MTRYLLATASVHTTAAAADYLGGRLDADDEVVVLTVEEDGIDSRDGADAANVARSRLVPAGVEVVEATGDPAAAVRETVSERDADEVVVGPRRGNPDAVGVAPGSTVTALLGDIDVPVVVVPLSAL